MLPRRYQGRPNSLLQFRISLVIVRWQSLLDPLDLVRLALARQLDGVGKGERHVTVDHDREVGTNGLTPFLHGGDVFPAWSKQGKLIDEMRGGGTR